MAWDPERYLRFQRERFAPFDDTLALVTRRPGLRVVDLGCGTGELTRRLADALDGSEVVGIDSSAEMLARAASHAQPGLRFERRAIEELDGDWDLIFSHAALHWCDEHQVVVPQLFARVRAGGQLVVQMPSNHDHASQHLIQATAAEEPFASALGGFRRLSPVRDIAFYADLLYACGGRALTVYEKVYPHELPDADAVGDWIRGTSMLPYLERLPAAMQDAFEARVRSRLRARWPSGPVFFGFRRTLFSATRA
jgi:trans-aconitate 2-methyltransferase